MHVTKGYLIGFFIFCLSFCTNIAGAAANTSIDELRLRVSEYVSQQLTTRGIVNNQSQTVSVKTMGIDPRLRLAKCDVPWTMNAKSERWVGRINTRIECRGSMPWSIYVPVQVRLTKDVVVANHSLMRGSLITAADVRTMSIDVTDFPRGYFTQVKPLIGKELRRSVATNNPISPAHVRDALAVKRGDEVTILASTSSLTIRSVGIALNDGRLGQQIRVKNSTSKRIIKAQVMRKGLVKVLI